MSRHNGGAETGVVVHTVKRFRDYDTPNIGSKAGLIVSELWLQHHEAAGAGIAGYVSAISRRRLAMLLEWYTEIFNQKPMSVDGASEIEAISIPRSGESKDTA
jgi:hypothetical protein